MPTILETALQMLAGANLAPSVVFLWFWFKQRHELEYAWSALLGISASGYIACSALEYNAPDLTSYLAILRWQPLFSSLVPASLLMLVLENRRQPSSLFKWTFRAFGAAVAIVGLICVVDPDLAFKAKLLHPLDLALGLGRLQLLEADTTNWSIPIWVFLFLTVLTGFVATCTNPESRRNSSGNRILRIVLGLIMISAVHDILAITYRFPWPYLMDPALSAITLLQARRILTDLLRSQALRREMAARTQIFELLFRQNPLACLVSRLEDGKILLANPRFIHLVAAESEKAILGRTSLEIGLWKDEVERNRELLAILKHGQGKSRSLWRRLDGTMVHVSHSVQKIQYEDSECILIMAEDVDQETRAEKALRESEAHARYLNAELEHRVDQRTRDMQAALDELESFTYSVSHDLRSPLRAIDGFALALAEDHAQSLGTTGMENISRIRNASRRMSSLIDDLLSLYRSSRVFVARTRIDVTELANELMRKYANATPRRTVQWTIQEGIVAHADAVLFGIAMEHLVSNAWKFTLHASAPEIHIDSRIVDGATWIRIRDNGEGFDMAHTGKLFGTFQRLHDAPEFEGNGIGLAIVKRIVTRHGGRIEVDSRPGKGTEFRFCLDAGVS